MKGKTVKRICAVCYNEFRFAQQGNLHRNVILSMLENIHNLTFQDYNLSTTGITPKNKKTARILKEVFEQA